MREAALCLKSTRRLKTYRTIRLQLLACSEGSLLRRRCGGGKECKLGCTHWLGAARYRSWGRVLGLGEQNGDCIVCCVV